VKGSSNSWPSTFPTVTIDSVVAWSPPTRLGRSSSLARSEPEGGFDVPVPPILFDEEAGDPPVVRDFATDTDEILRQIRIDDEEIDRLRLSGCIA